MKLPRWEDSSPKTTPGCTGCPLFLFQQGRSVKYCKGCQQANGSIQKPAVITASTPVRSKQRWMSSKYKMFPFAITGMETASLTHRKKEQFNFEHSERKKTKGKEGCCSLHQANFLPVCQPGVSSLLFSESPVDRENLLPKQSNAFSFPFFNSC